MPDRPRRERALERRVRRERRGRAEASEEGLLPARPVRHERAPALRSGGRSKRASATSAQDGRAHTLGHWGSGESIAIRSGYPNVRLPVGPNAMASAGAGATEPRRSGTADTAGSVDMLRQAAGRAVDSGVDAALRAIQRASHRVVGPRCACHGSRPSPAARRSPCAVAASGDKCGRGAAPVHRWHSGAARAGGAQRGHDRPVRRAGEAEM